MNRVPAGKSALILLLSILAISAAGWSAFAVRGGRPSGNLRRLASVESVNAGPPIIALDPVDQVQLPDSIRSFAHAGNALYVSLAFGGLATFDIAEPSRPVLKHQLSGMLRRDDPAARIILEVLPDGNRLIAADRRQGFSVYDVTDPFAPRPEWNRSISTDPNDQVVSVSRVKETYFLSCGGAGLRMLNGSFGPETAPEVVLRQFDHTRRSIFFPPDLLLVSDGYDTGMHILKLGGKGEPLGLLGTFQTGTYCDEVIPIGQHAILSNRNYGFTIVDLSDPIRPFLSSYYYTRIATRSAIKSMVLWRGRFLFAGNEFKVIDVFDLADPAKPIRIASIPVETGVNTMHLVDDWLYVGFWQARKMGIFRLHTVG